MRSNCTIITSFSVDEIEMTEDRNARKNKIDELMNAEDEQRVNNNSMVAAYFKDLEEKERACINKECCQNFYIKFKSCACFFCRGRRRFCGLICFMFILLILLYVLTRLGYIYRPNF